MGSIQAIVPLPVASAQSNQSYEDVHGQMPCGPPIDADGLAQQVQDHSCCSRHMQPPPPLAGAAHVAASVRLRFGPGDVLPAPQWLELSTPVGMDGVCARLKPGALDREMERVAASVREHALHDVVLAVEQLLDQPSCQREGGLETVEGEPLSTSFECFSHTLRIELTLPK